jgi:hypothetical protein
MTHRNRSMALSILLLAFAGNLGRAADPEFKAALITESRAFERETASVTISGLRTPAAKEWINRVTVALDGERITAEWAAKTRIGATAQDFPRGTDVPAATTRNQLLLKHSDGSVVTAKIVRRVKPEDARTQRGRAERD